MIWYLPSCAFTRRHPETSERFCTWLKDRGVGIAGCCKEHGGEFAPGDTVLYNCVSCVLSVEEQSPGAHPLSVYEYLLDKDDFPWPDLNGEEIVIQDCLRARSRTALQAAAREDLKRMNARPVELADRGASCTFDGVFLMKPLPERTIHAAPRAYGEIANFVTLRSEDEQERLMREHAALIAPRRAAAYCNSCFAGLLKGGANAVHLLDLICSRL